MTRRLSTEELEALHGGFSPVYPDESEIRPVRGLRAVLQNHVDFLRGVVLGVALGVIAVMVVVDFWLYFGE